MKTHYTQSSEFIIRILTRTRRIHWQIQMYLRTGSGVIREKNGLLSSWDVWITVLNDLDHSFCNYINLCASFPTDLKSPNSFHHNDDWILHIVTCCELGLAKTSCENNVDISSPLRWYGELPHPAVTLETLQVIWRRVCGHLMNFRSVFRTSPGTTPACCSWRPCHESGESGAGQYSDFIFLSWYICCLFQVLKVASQ